ncbi:MAG: hypothetical protein ACOC3Y_04755, partial [Desulfohalobiaceae bacterium]
CLFSAVHPGAIQDACVYAALSICIAGILRLLAFSNTLPCDLIGNDCQCRIRPYQLDSLCLERTQASMETTIFQQVVFQTDKSDKLYNSG